MTSVLYNAAATTALRVLQSTNDQLDKVENRISTGLKIGEAKDNAAYWSISTTLKSDNAAMSSVSDALGLGAATVDTAYTGLNNALDVLNSIKEKLTSATQDGVDAQAVQDEISALQDQLESIATSSSFSGENWLSVNSGVSGYSATKSVVSSFTRDANNSVSIGTITIDTSDIVLYDSYSSSGILDSAVQLTDSDGNALSVGGTDATGSAPGTQGLDTATSTAGEVTATATAAVASLGTLNMAGFDTNDTITFNIAVDGAAAQYVEFTLGSVASDGSDFATNMQSAIDGVIGSGKVTVAVDGTTSEITITSATTGASSSVAVTSVTAVDGDGDATDALGLSNSTVATFGTGTAASSSFSFSGTSDAGDTLDFRFQYNGDVYQAQTVTLTAGISESDFATALQTAIDNATKISDGSTFGGGLSVSGNGSGTITFETDDTGADQNFAIVQVTTDDVDSDGTTAANINMGLAVTATVSGTGTAAAYDLGAFDATNYDAGDQVQFDVTVYTDSSGSISADRQTLSVAAASTIGDMTTNLQAAFNEAYGAGVVTVSNDGTNITVTTVGTGENYGLAFDNFAGVDGDGATTSVLGLTAGSDTGTAATTAAAAYATLGSTFSSSVTFDDGDSLSFDVAIDGGTATTVTITKDTIDEALSTTDGIIADGDDFAAVINQALSDASVTGLTASNSSGTITIAKSSTGSGSVAISNVESSTGADTISVADIDISDSALAALGVDDTTRADVLSAYISVVNQAITNVTAAASSLGAVASRIELQQTFVTDLMDTIDEGVSGLVDADMNAESTRLQALQVQQQLGVQALSIANSTAQNVLALFQ
ncbi:flagellin [Consotaella aegiceratis]|uniref:flagellin N-terminal helical domain-containing protein n=1 Tax=Consotaella aegiceratis TaxID=3097961 RepID=UPI002F3F7308